MRITASRNQRKLYLHQWRSEMELLNFIQFFICLTFSQTPVVWGHKWLTFEPPNIISSCPSVQVCFYTMTCDQFMLLVFIYYILLPKQISLMVRLEKRKMSSSTRAISPSAPQGCVLFSLLFSLYTNDSWSSQTTPRSSASSGRVMSLTGGWTADPLMWSQQPGDQLKTVKMNLGRVKFFAQSSGFWFHLQMVVL